MLNDPSLPMSHRGQRNRLDVALELTQLHHQIYEMTNEDEIEKQFAKYYSLIKVLEATTVKDLHSLVPKAILEEMNRKK